MDMLIPLLPDIWLFIIGFFLLYYAVADGFDLGVGILSLFARDERERGIMKSSIKSVWHGNQTWLVLLGGMVFGAFPVFYGVVLSSLYIPILLMLFGIILRGVSLEFREHSESKRLWGLAFGIGSAVIAIGQGFALGGLLGGLQIEEGKFVGSVWGWLNPFSTFVTIGVLFGYTMLGANYLIWKTTGNLQQRSYGNALMVASATLVVSIGVHLWITATHPSIMRKWTTLPDLYYVALFPVLAALSFIMLYRSLLKRRELAPLLWNAAIVLFSFIGLSIGYYPSMIPSIISVPITVNEAAASPNTLIFMLVVTGILLPVILIYTAYEYRVFRGKTTDGRYGE